MLAGSFPGHDSSFGVTINILLISFTYDIVFYEDMCGTLFCVIAMPLLSELLKFFKRLSSFSFFIDNLFVIFVALNLLDNKFMARS